MNLFQEYSKKIPNNVPNIIKTEDHECKKCGRKYTLAYFEDGTTTKVGCDCDIIDEGLKTIEESKRLFKKRKADAIFNRSIINVKTRNARFDTYEPNTEQLQLAKRIALRYVEAFEINKPRSLYMHGSFGTGKSHLAYSIAHELKEKGFTVLFMNVSQLMTTIRNSFNDKSGMSEQEIMTLIAEVDLMIFDDIGTNLNDFGMSKLFEMIESRVGRHNIYTTNMTSKEMTRSKDWQRMFSRMTEDAYFVEMNGEDYRLK